MTHKEILKLLNSNDIPFVLVGGTALRLYNSPRVTHDIDISIKMLDVDKVLQLLYMHGYCLVTEVGNITCSIILSPDDAGIWIDTVKAGSASLIELKSKPKCNEIPHQEIDITTQIDFLFELGIPFMRLKKNARTIELENTSFLVASPEDLLLLKQQRENKTEADLDDIRFLLRLVRKQEPE